MRHVLAGLIGIGGAAGRGWRRRVGLLGVAVAGSLMVGAGCGGEATFEVQEIRLRPLPDWVTPVEDFGFKVRVVVEFDDDVDPTTLSAPGTFRLDLTGTNDGRRAIDVPGTFQVQGDTAVYISDETLGTIINPQAGENLGWEITLRGSGPGAVQSTSGELLDGDSDGNPGGTYFEEFETVG